MFLDFIISVLLDIQHQVSSICPEKASVSRISVMLDDKNLCNVRVYCVPPQRTEEARHAFRRATPEGRALDMGLALMPLADQLD
jgi:hypothetical protein